MISALQRLFAPLTSFTGRLQGFRRRELLERCEALKGADQLPTRERLEQLQRAWLNPLYVGDVDYLEALCAHAARTKGPVLECGSGLSTLLLGLLAERYGFNVWTLEHQSQWLSRVGGLLSDLNLSRVHLQHAQLRDFGAYSWYDAPPLPQGIQLVICDGPPGFVHGGRRGLLPQVHTRLAEGCTILLDDAHRPNEQEAIAYWLDGFPVRLVTRTRFAVLEATQRT